MSDTLTNTANAESLHSTDATGPWLWFGGAEIPAPAPFAHHTHTADALDSLQQAAELCVLALPPAQQDQALRELRQHPLTRFSMILCSQESPLSPALANGPWQGYQPPQLESYRTRINELTDSTNKGLINQLCRYLWLHEAELRPIYDPSHHSRYSYPLLECWSLDASEAFAPLLQRWLKSELIEQAELVERIRVCAHCQSGHLNYSEVCPSCHSIDLQQEVALHCFRCGSVAPQAQFQRLNGLQCPNCHNSLRHIGVDYDRPIENQRCNSCHQLFAEAPVVARCQSCQHENSTEELLQYNIASYRLALRGRQLVRQGEAYLQQHWALSHHQQPRQLFFQQLCWLNDLAHRHDHSHQLVALNLPGFKAFYAQVGEVRAFGRLDALFARLRELLRTSDRCCQLGDDQLLILLPHTPSEGLQVIIQRLQELEQQQSTDPLEFELNALSLPDTQLQQDAEQWLFDRLSAEPAP